MKSLTIFDARSNGTSVARVLASSYSQARMLLSSGKVAYDELEDCGPDEGVAGVAYQTGLGVYRLHPHGANGNTPAMRTAIARLLLGGYTTHTIQLEASNADQPTLEAFAQAKFAAALHLDETGERPRHRFETAGFPLPQAA